MLGSTGDTQEGAEVATWFVRSMSVRLWPVALSVALTSKSTKLPGSTPRRSPGTSEMLARSLLRPLAARVCQPAQHASQLSNLQAAGMFMGFPALQPAEAPLKTCMHRSRVIPPVLQLQLPSVGVG